MKEKRKKNETKTVSEPIENDGKHVLESQSGRCRPARKFKTQGDTSWQGKKKNERKTVPENERKTVKGKRKKNEQRATRKKREKNENFIFFLTKALTWWCSSALISSSSNSPWWRSSQCLPCPFLAVLQGVVVCALPWTECEA